jgi:GT2 family glycosyltransferase
MRNEAGQIGGCLESLLAQDFPAEQTEILVVDGRSTDESRERVERVAASHPHVRLLDNPRRIIAAGLNVGIRAARGRYILRADCKSRYDPSYVRTCVHYLERTDAANVGGPCLSEPGDETAMARTIAAVSSHPFVMGGSRYRTNLTDEEYADGAIYGAWRRALFDRLGWFNEALERGEDNEFNSRILKAGGRILKTPKIVVHYRCRSTLGAFLAQTFRNGLWHVPTLAANRRAFRLRHFAPAGWVCWLAGFGSASAVDGAFLLPLVGGAAIYAAALAMVTAQLFRWHGLPVAALVPTTVAAFHLVYGLGTIAGAVRFGVFEPGRLRRARQEGGCVRDGVRSPYTASPGS